MSDKQTHIPKEKSNVSSHILWWHVPLFSSLKLFLLSKFSSGNIKWLYRWKKPSLFMCRAVSHTLVAVTDVAKFVVLEEDPLELAGGVWATTDLLFVLFAPLAALAEWEKINLKPPEDVLLGRFSLSSLSFAKTKVKFWTYISKYCQVKASEKNNNLKTYKTLSLLLKR